MLQEKDSYGWGQYNFRDQVAVSLAMNENKDSRCGQRSLYCSIIQVVSTDWEQIDKCSEKG